MNAYFKHESAYVDDGAIIGAGTKVWHFSHIMKGAIIGERCVFGQNVNVDGGVVIGNNVKVQNNVSIYTGITIEDDVFLGPSCVLTNVTNPRSQVNRHNLYEKTLIRRGATIGANATIVCGITLGRYCFIAASSVVTQNVPDYALLVGNPARQKGWMSRHGHLLIPGPDGIMTCPESGLRYRFDSPTSGDGFAHDQPAPLFPPLSPFKPTLPPPLPPSLRCLDLDEESPLPPHLAQGTKSYDDFKATHH
jgi:UDP-2-acetamido-3-amino-2,3-dideoxy-glucuronate N-acetyltransferase